MMRLAINNTFGRGRPIPADPLPDWYSEIAPGTWGTVTTQSLNASGVFQYETGTNGPLAYSGGFINTKGIYNGATFIPGLFLCIWGGGHSNYGGNEIYAYGPLASNSAQWYRLRDRTIPFPEDLPAGEDAFGNPVSRHTYDSMAYVNDGSRNWMLAMGGLYGYSSATYGDEYVRAFDFDVASPNTNFPWIKKSMMPSARGAVTTAYELSSGKVWSHAHSYSLLSCYDVGADSFTSASSGAGNLGGSCDIDTNRGLLGWLLQDCSVRFYRTNNGVSNSIYTPSTTGDGPSDTSKIMSMVWDRQADCFRAWCSEGKKIYKLSPPSGNPYQGGDAWVWSNETPATGATPTTATSEGVSGRFAYVDTPSMSGCILMNSAYQSLYFYRPA